MIRLIASDLDGTLLTDGTKELPPDFFEVLDMLFERDIMFAVASGRTYSAADHFFPPEYIEKMMFICDNGACISHGNKILHIEALDERTYFEFLDACERIGGLRLVVCTSGGVYHLRSSDEFFNEVGRFYRKHSAVDNLRDVRDTVYKFAVYDELGAEAHGKAELDKIFQGRLNVQVSGPVWMDVMAMGVSKGSALTRLRMEFGISAEETMAFGDYFNDVEMLQSVKWSFCTENGHEDVKKLCSHVCGDCNHGGVTKAIRQYALGDTIKI